MNCLKADRQIAVLSALVEGNSIRSVERMTGIHRDTIMRLMVKTGFRCLTLLDEKIKDLTVKQVQVDEVWSYVGKKEKHVKSDDNALEVGDQYIFVAIDAETKLIPSFVVGKRTGQLALQLMRDLQWRVNNRFQLTTDGFRPYIDAVERTWGPDIDYSQLVKVYSGDESARERYSPSEIAGAFPTPIQGHPDRRLISTSHVERQNLTMRMQMRRLTRLTNGFSKKLANLKAAVALHIAHYNFLRLHGTLKTTPAMAAGVTGHIWTWEELLAN
jgi:IS1 family transposase